MKKKIRQSNFELMRIISMFFIVIWHIIVHGGLLNNTIGVNHFLIQLILCIIVVHVNSFILISGFFQYSKNFSLKKFLSVFFSWCSFCAGLYGLNVPISGFS